MHKIILMQRAQKDLNQIYNFCANISFKYANKVVNEIFNYILTLQVFPRGFPQIFIDNLKYKFRKIPVNRYQIIYLIYKEDIFIIRIFDTRQNPKKFKINY